MPAAQSALLLFDSDAVPLTPGEDEETNPGIYGRALAEWVRDRLREPGLPAEPVIAEDFDWRVPLRLPPHAVYVACARDADTDVRNLIEEPVRS